MPRCPRCWSEDVGGWSAGYGSCLDCGVFAFNNYDPCRECKSRNIQWKHGTDASCGNCGWTGCPYDLIDCDE